jgi:uncharacterized RDD family membrane protein YckC
MKTYRNMFVVLSLIAWALALPPALVGQEAAQASVQAVLADVQTPAPSSPPVVTTPPVAQAPPSAPRGRGAARATAPAPAPQAPAMTPEEQAEAQLDAERDAAYDSSRDIVRIGQDVVVPAGATARDVVVVSGSATIEGRVVGDVTVVLGQLRLGPNAIVDRDVVVVAGVATVASGAKARRDLVIAGGSLDAPADFAPGREQVVIGTSGMGNRFAAAVPWITRGLLMGRPVVPSLGWTWWLLAIIFFVYALLGLFFKKAVWLCAEAVSARPMSTFMSGLLVLLLVGPALFILTVSVVGIVVVPFALVALVAGWLLGKIGVLRAIGHAVVAEPEDKTALAGVRSLAIGFAIMTVAYAIPIVGMLAFVLLAVFGLGSAWLAMLTAWRRENPAKPKPPKPGVPPPAPPVPPTSTYGAPDGEQPQTPSAAAFSGIESGSAEASVASSAAMGASRDQPADAGSLLGMPKATLGQRAAAFGIDFVLVLLAMGIFLSRMMDDGPGGFFFLLLLYHVIFWTMKQTTVGGIICNLRVVRTDGAAVGFSEALIRGLASILSLVTLGIGCLWIAWDPDRQAWHDRIAGTYVVRVPKSWPL